VSALNTPAEETDIAAAAVGPNVLRVGDYLSARALSQHLFH
jgi:hypothetical protein